MPRQADLVTPQGLLARRRAIRPHLGLAQLIAALAILLLAGSGSATVIDQQNPLAGAEGNLQMQYAGPLGQEFVPIYDTLTAIDVLLKDGNTLNPSLPITLNVRENTITGGIIASGVATPFDGAFTQDYVSFDLGGAVSITPFATYVFEIIAANSRGFAVTTSDRYAPGSYVFQGSPNTGGDLVFTTYAAAAVPEPSTALLLGLGLVALTARQRQLEAGLAG